MPWMGAWSFELDVWLFDICGLMVMVLLLKKVTLGLITGLLAAGSSLLDSGIFLFLSMTDPMLSGEGSEGCISEDGWWMRESPLGARAQKTSLGLTLMMK